MSARKKHTVKVPLILRVVPFYVVTAGLLWAGNFLFASPQPVAHAQPVVAQSIPVKPSVHVISGQPTRITVDRLGIDLPINNGYYDASTKQWTLSEDAAYFATMTILPNNNHGNTFIYGHNTSKVFAPLKNITVGDVVTVYTSNNHAFQYTYRSDAVVTPDITNVLYEDPATPQLTIMTCEGIWSKVRRIMYFDLKEVS